MEGIARRYSFGKKLVPRLGQFEALYYALDLNSDDCRLDLPAAARVDAPIRPPPPDDAVYVAPGGRGDGSFQKPLGDVQRGYDLAATRASQDGAGTRLHGAVKVHFLCAQRGARVLLNISATFRGSPDR